VKRANRTAIRFKVLGLERPRPGWIVLGRIKSKGDDDELGIESLEPPQSPGEGVPVLILRLSSRAAEVEIVTVPVPPSPFISEAGEVGIGEPGMAMEGDGEHVASFVEDLLGPVSVW